MAAVVPIVNTILKGIEFVSKFGNENQRLQGEIKGSLVVLSGELGMAKWDMVKYEGGVEELTLEMQELLCDIEDFICDLSIPEKPAGFLRYATGTDSRPEDIHLIQSFLTRIENIRKWQDQASSKGGNSTPSSSSSAESRSPPSYAPEEDLLGFPETKDDFLELLSPSHAGEARVISVVGCAGVGKTALAWAVYEATSVVAIQPAPPATEIREDITNAVLQSAPARAQEEAGPFHCKAWVVASTCNDAEDLLSKVLLQVDPTPAGGRTSEDLHKFLQDKRYLVIIDDLQTHGVQWKDIKHGFPENGKDSRIIVTTTVQSIARKCSSGSYFVYQIQCLGEAISERLFWKKFHGTGSENSPSVPQGNRSKQILAKCDGLPLALISAGNYFCFKDTHPVLSEDRCKKLCQELENIVVSEEIAFGEMIRTLVQCYNSLPDNDCKNCLLYLSIFPRGHQINSKSVIRRLKAEELVAGDALQCLKELIDRSMIEPAPIGHNSNVAKRCQVQGMMLEFSIRESVSRNLVMLVDDEGNVRHNKPGKQDPPQKTRCKARRVAVQSSCSTQNGSNPIPEDIGLSSVRSLTIFKSKLPETRVDAVDFKSCKMMRVLDLEGCQGLNTAVLDDICELLFLNYLSLKNTDAEELPTKMKNLQRLETLDIRQTRVAMLPVEVIMLPELAYVLGEFELPLIAGRERRALVDFLENRSKMHTLSGIVINKTRSFEIVILHARKLKKVKICGKYTTPASAQTTPAPDSRFPFFGVCFGFSRESSCPNPKLAAPNGSASNLPTPTGNLVANKRLVGVLVSSLQKRFAALESISIDSSGISKAFLASIRTSRIISSLKLRGVLTSLPGTLKELTNLNRLHLISTRLTSDKLVEALQSLDCLEYLKLAEEERHASSWDGDFAVPQGGFSALLELCFEGPNKHPRVLIAQGAMRVLTSLQLLCPQSPPALTGVAGLEHLTKLNEVILHSCADEAAVGAWKEAAKQHTNMPCVKKQSPHQISNTP